MTSGVFIVCVIAFVLGLVIMGIYEVVALTTRKVPTITEMVQHIILHFVPNELKRRKVAAPIRPADVPLRQSRQPSV